jgi:hypothetical protein
MYLFRKEYGGAIQVLVELGNPSQTVSVGKKLEALFFYS